MFLSDLLIKPRMINGVNLLQENPAFLDIDWSCLGVGSVPEVRPAAAN
jgi:hypothetical protein